MTRRAQILPPPRGDAGRDAPRFGLWSGAAVVVVCACAPPAPGALGQTIEFAAASKDLDLFGFALAGGLAIFSAVVSLIHIAQRKSWSRREAKLATDLRETRAKLDRANIYLSSEPQIFIAWDGPRGEADIEGSPLVVMDAPAPRRVLGFGAWLTPADATELEHKVERLRTHGEAFHLPLVGATGRHYDADGRAVGAAAVLRIREVSGDRLELIKLRERHAESLAETDNLRALFEAMPTPVWMRNAQGRLTFVNSAYARAVEAKDAKDAVVRQLELLDQCTRTAASASYSKKSVWSDRVNAVVAGARHLLDVTKAVGANSMAAIAIDRNEIEKVRADLEQQMQAHVRTLDQLPTGVAVFDRSKKLVYRNAAYDALWRIDPAFLEQRPNDGEILDRLRAEQRLPAESDYKAWKNRLHEAYRSPEQHLHTWHMPNGRTLRVVVNPNPQGGVTYLYDDMSERYELETRYNALDRMRTETLEALHEGVAVFGADGRLQFSNPAFAKLWRLDPNCLANKPRFEAVEARFRELHDHDDAWAPLRGLVTGLGDVRAMVERRIDCVNGDTLDCTAQPLPEGASLLTFVDVTADVNVERALTDSNKTLLAAEKLRNDFIHHVSYELRSPLNNINGFVHLLGEESTGFLNERQQEYLGYVRKSSAALLAIIDDILDLASIDENALELKIEDVDAKATMSAAIEGVQDRLVEYGVELQIVAADGVGSFRGDSKRVRQILFNLLSNAIGFSRAGQTVTLAALRRGEDIVFKVTDCGRGIPPEIIERVFDRFESHTAGSRHRGVGLGLSIVRDLMELHGGTVHIDSAPGEGTTVTCIFPALGRAGENPGPTPEPREGERAR